MSSIAAVSAVAFCFLLTGILAESSPYTVVNDSAIKKYNNNCQWLVGGQLLDLSPLSNQYLNGVAGDSFFYVTPCRNDMSCLISGEYYMAVEAQGNVCVRWLAQYYAEQQPQCSSENGGTFTFQYLTADETQKCPDGIQTDIRYVCSPMNEVNPLEVVVSEACLVILEEKTSVACLDVSCNAGTDCYWSEPALQLELDLRPLQELPTPIECAFSQFFMQFQPCRNSIPCMSSVDAYMAALLDINTHVCVLDLASFDMSVVPVDSSTADAEQYTFHYQNGRQSGACFTPREMFVTLICDGSADALPYDAESVECGEYMACVYYMNIRTQYACSGSRPTTPAPVPTVQQVCNWPILDISALARLSEPITCAFDAGFSVYFLYYSPCHDSVSCMLDGQFMVTQTNANTNICIVDLASEDESVVPVDVSDGNVEKYELHYRNGKVSGSCFSPREIVITFICDQDAVPYNSQEVVCGEIAQCVYFFDIPTIYACNKNKL